ncbi:MAG TPA: nucleoside deaminase [Acidimicrobiales bacterium]|nr:nucleoside deaminase [Acidimicrobiales bacterium]
MEMAMAEAALATAHGDVPVGAVVTVGGTVISSRHNERELRSDPMAHAEFLAVRDAARTLRGGDLAAATVFVTLEPCVMCAGALLTAGVGAVVFGAADPKAGACGSRYDVLGDVRLGHGPTVHGGLLADESASMLRTFFATRRR